MIKLNEILVRIKNNEANELEYKQFEEITEKEAGLIGKVANIVIESHPELSISNYDDFISKRRNPLGKEEMYVLENEITGSLLGVGEAVMEMYPNL